MNNLLTAIMTRCTGSAFSTDVGGRIYLDEAPEQATYPNAVFSIVSSVPEDTFSESLENTLIQFSLRSLSQSATEITTMYGHLKTLFKNAPLTITSGVNVLLTQENLTTVMEDITTPTGTVGCRAWHVEYAILVQAT